MKQYLNLDRDCLTISETFKAIGSTLRNVSSFYKFGWFLYSIYFCIMKEFPFPDLVKLKDAQQGHEEELVKVIII